MRSNASVYDVLGLDVDGPHSSDFTVNAARAIAYAVRFLNYATLPTTSCPGLAGPPDVYEVLGALTRAAQLLPQLTEQLADYLTAQHAAGAVAVTRGYPHAGDPAGAAAEARAALSAATAAAEQLAAALNQAWSATAGMVWVEHDHHDPGDDHDDQDGEDPGEDGQGAAGTEERP